MSLPGKFILDSKNLKNNFIIDAIKKQNLSLYYQYDDLFKYTQYDATTYKNKFLEFYLDETKVDVGLTFPYKLLIDTFLYYPPYSVFCFNEPVKGKFALTKGSKKVIAYAMNNIKHAHILFVSESEFQTEIKTDEELYWLLRKISPMHHNFCITLIGDDRSIHIHTAEDITTEGKWKRYEEIDVELLKYALPNLDVKVKFSGSAYTSDSRIIPVDNNWDCHVESSLPIDFNLSYLFLCSTNNYFKKYTRIGTTLDQTIKISYNRINDPLAADFFIPAP